MQIIFYNNIVRRKKVTPAKVIATVGDTVKFICPSEEPRVLWTFKGKSLTGTFYTGRFTAKDLHWLILTSVELINAGTYTCSGAETESILFEDNATLIVNSK